MNTFSLKCSHRKSGVEHTLRMPLIKQCIYIGVRTGKICFVFNADFVPKEVYM